MSPFLIHHAYFLNRFKICKSIATHTYHPFEAFSLHNQQPISTFVYIALASDWLLVIKDPPKFNRDNSSFINPKADGFE